MACLVLGGIAAACQALGWQVSAALACGGAYLAGGWSTAREAAAALAKGHLTVDVLMILAAIGAAAIGDWREGAVLLFLFSLSGTLEKFAMYRTSRSIEALMTLRPQEALVVMPQENGSTQDVRVPVESLQVGQTLRVRPGDRFPVDGRISDGETWADESTLTGESQPIAKRVGDPVFAGTINGQGSILVRMTRAVADTTLERIVHMVQEAQAQKTPAQRLVESWQRPYVLGVLAASTAVLLAARYLHTSSWYDAFYHAMVLLVAASPCAVVVSSPAVMLAAIARAGRHGVLFKGAVHLESLGKIDVVAFDKTGTVTVGKPGVTEFWVAPAVDGRKLLALAAAVEQRSEHPLAEPIVAEALRQGIEPAAGSLREFHSHTGLGVHARIDGQWVGIGRETLFETHDMPLPAAWVEQAERIRASGQTALFLLAERDRQGGVVGVADQVRPEAPRALAALRELGVERIVILSGDHRRVAAVIGSALGADEVFAELLPENKVQQLRQLAAGGTGVAMVGDGVNDAPALAAARVGIAMGGAGSDVALEVADVVLMGDDLRGLPLAVGLSRLAMRRIRQNMTFAFSMIGVLVIATFFDLPLWLGVLGHEGSTVLVVLNGLRILWERLPHSALATATAAAAP